jgi:eukaryotic-like serine/threonine-protein kinase
MAILAKHTQEVELPEKWSGAVPAGVTVVLCRALQRGPQDRYASIRDFADALAETSVVIPMSPEKAAPPQVKREPKIGDEYHLEMPDGLRMDFVYVPAGEFLMGAAWNDRDAFTNEKPQHKVYLDAYWIGKYPVTNAQYKVCKPEYKYPKDKKDHPVVDVDWREADAFCAWLSDYSRESIKLPTEAQWEKAARGTDGRNYPWGNGAPTPQLANYDGHIKETTTVGRYPAGASPYGALDMAGNVWEWVADRYDGNYYSRSPYENPLGPTGADDAVRIVRGGSWLSIDRFLRVSLRSGDYPDLRNDISGFRCLRSP